METTKMSLELTEAQADMLYDVLDRLSLQESRFLVRENEALPQFTYELTYDAGEVEELCTRLAVLTSAHPADASTAEGAAL